MGGYDGIGIAVGNGIGAFDIDHCIREDGTLNDTADTILSIFLRLTWKNLRLAKGCEVSSVCRKTTSMTRRFITSTTAAKGWKCICRCD